MDDGLFAKAVATSVSVAGVLRILGRAFVGSNYRFVKREVARLGLDTTHWKGQAHGTSKSPQQKGVEVLVENGTAARGLVKKLLRREGLIPYLCALCGLGPEWNGKPLVLRLDHRNGRRNDHRLENLRFLCPNCDSQTDTFCGRNKPPAEPTGHRGSVCSCGGPMGRRSERCRSCEAKVRVHPTKVIWPASAELRAKVAATSAEAVGRSLGVSGKAVAKRLKNHP